MRTLKDSTTGIILRNTCARIKQGKIIPIRNKKTGAMAAFTTHRECNRFLAGFARYYHVPAWLTIVNNQPTVTFRHGIATYTAF